MATTITTRTVQLPLGTTTFSVGKTSDLASPSPPPMTWPPSAAPNQKTTRGGRRLSQPLPTLSSGTFDSLDESDSSPPSPASLPGNQHYRPSTALSPPPTPVAQKSFPSSTDRNSTESISVHRLRSNSGLALHTSNAALRRYIDYNADGSTRLEAMDEAPSSSTLHSSSDDVTHTGSVISSTRGASASPVPFAPPSLFSRDTVLAVLQDPVTRSHLWEFARSRSNEETLEFLQKVEEYNQAVHGVVALLATISTKYTGLAATQSLKLPQQLRRSLNADVMHISRSVLPGLEMLFGEVTSYIEDHIVRDIYPAFVRHQLSLRMKASLSPPSHRAPASSFRFSGLGHAFCLTDPHRVDNPVVYASDSFARIIGYPRAEDVPRSGRCLSGIRQNDWREIKEETTENIVLNRRHWDRQPFWSYVSECPLQSPRGCTRFSLVSLVDMSDVVKSQDDILDALRCDPIKSRPASKGNNQNTHVEEAATHTHTAAKWTKWPSSAKPAGLSKSFMMPFSRKQRAADHDDRPSSGQDNFIPVAIQYQPKLPASSDNLVTTSSDGNLPMYSRFMLLQMTSDQAESNDASTKSAVPSMSTSTAAVARLKVAFCSAPMLEMLGLTSEGQDAVLYYDVFAVLANLAGSSAITPHFRNAVYQHMDAAEYTSLEFSIPAAGSPPSGGFSNGLGIGMSSPVRRAAEGRKGTADGFPSRRPSRFLFGRTKKCLGGERTTSNATTVSDLRRNYAKRKQRLMSHWTPLKDAQGSVEWVVLVLSPATR